MVNDLSVVSVISKKLEYKIAHRTWTLLYKNYFKRLKGNMLRFSQILSEITVIIYCVSLWFSFLDFYWLIILLAFIVVTLKCYVSFYWTAKWISYMYTYIPTVWDFLGSFVEMWMNREAVTQSEVRKRKTNII